MRTAQPTVEIEEVLDRARRGVTEPLICRGDDGQVYFVQGRSAGRRSLVSRRRPMM
ncbi:HipA family kinase [Comamonas endophytica]|uniref:HipA family kinase n=1 Tax=Comamonas endophytica TaxID=2949090 RepID=UPI0029880187|nr:HipA family kinase [Acidovorax sp. 5MLIR]